MNSNKVTALSIMLLASVAGNVHSMSHLNRAWESAKNALCNFVGGEVSEKQVAATPALSLNVPTTTRARQTASMPTPNVTAPEVQPSMLNNVLGSVATVAATFGSSIVSGAKTVGNEVYNRAVAPVRSYVATNVYPYAKAYVAGGTMVAGVKSKVALTAAALAGIYGVYKLHKFAFPAKATVAQQGDATAKPGMISRLKGAVVDYTKKAKASLTGAYKAAKNRLTGKKATPSAKAAAQPTASAVNVNATKRAVLESQRDEKAREVQALFAKKQKAGLSGTVIQNDEQVKSLIAEIENYNAQLKAL